MRASDCAGSVGKARSFRPRGHDIRECLSDVQIDLRSRLVAAIKESLPLARTVEDAERCARQSYRRVAEILVALRHEFTGRDGRSPDLCGRSLGYRKVVRFAYREVGAAAGTPVQKRLTAGVAYWVRKLLLEQYGEAALRTMGVLQTSGSATIGYVKATSIEIHGDRAYCLARLVSLLNELAVDPTFTPAEDAVRSAVRAVRILQARLDQAASARERGSAA